ncbi:hypothetical protein Areg01_02410 [Actinoplanes regularis]|nr:hypothetical protein Areg01_02410 [Actinoplanes regularis]
MLPRADAPPPAGGDPGLQEPAEEDIVHPEQVTRPEPARLRTSDTEREEIAEIVRAAMAEGRLSLDEGEERLAGAYAAKYRDELDQLTRDLPHGGRQALARMPHRRAATRRSLQRHGSFVMIAAGVLTALWLLSGAHWFWPAIPLFFLVMGLIRHACWGHYELRYTHTAHLRH